MILADMLIISLTWNYCTVCCFLQK